jgi:sulfate adenylyltransferase subunit 2
VTQVRISTDQVLDALEAEAINILRETAGAFKNPVLMYSIGKDSSVLMELARKAFLPAPIPFTFLHIDTFHKFKAMTEFRDRKAAEIGFKLLVHTNPEGLNGAVTPWTHGAQEYTRVMKTVALRQALDAGGYDAAIGGARRDEERSRSKERVFSLREPGHRWEPRNQRPEMWRTRNTTLSDGQTMRVFPLSNWTEIDVWRYIKRENIEIVPLYYAAPRRSVIRDNQIIVLDDDRMPLQANEQAVERLVRFRSLGCYPLTAAIESTASNMDELVAEMELMRVSERAGRLIDGDREASMEAKKTEGYF